MNNYLFSKITMVGIIIYTILCIQGVAKPPQDFWQFVTIFVASTVIIGLEEK